MPKVSIIVPVYNVEGYISKCIESIVLQNFSDWELLLVDDGSIDNSGYICDKYALDDKRIKVYHTENNGVSAARNLGIDKAEGDWVVFVDGDDWINENCLSLSYQEAIKNNVQLLQYSYVHVYSNGDIKHLNRLSTRVMDGVSYIKNGTYNLCVWGAIINRFFIKKHHIKFLLNEVVGEDVHFMANVLMNCERVMYMNEELLYYYHNIDSISHVRDNKTTLKTCYMFVEIAESFPVLKSFCDKQIIGYLNELVCIGNISEKEISKFYRNANITDVSFSLKNSYFVMAPISPKLAFYVRRWLFLVKRFYSLKFN